MSLPRKSVLHSQDGLPATHSAIVSRGKPHVSLRIQVIIPPQQPPTGVNFGTFIHWMLMLEHNAQRWHSNNGRFSNRSWVCATRFVQTSFGRKCLSNVLTPFSGSTLTKSGMILLQRPTTVYIGVLRLLPAGLQSPGMITIGRDLHVRRLVLRGSHLPSVLIT